MKSAEDGGDLRTGDGIESPGGYRGVNERGPEVCGTGGGGYGGGEV